MNGKLRQGEKEMWLFKKKDENWPQFWKIENINIPEGHIVVNFTPSNFEKFVMICHFVVYQTKDRQYAFDPDYHFVFTSSYEETKQ